MSGQRSVRAVSLVDQVADTIRQRIVEGKLPVGTRMPSGAAMAEEIGVSVSVVREALSRLQTLGLVETRHGFGTTVVASSESATGFRIGNYGTWEPRMLAQLFDFRIDVEAAACMHAAAIATTADVTTLRRALRAISRSISKGTSGTDADMAFHVAIARTSRNVYRLQLIEYLNNEIHDAIDIARRNSARRPGLPEIVLREHEAVVLAIERRDEIGAGRAMRKHLTSAAQRLGLPTFSQARKRTI